MHLFNQTVKYLLTILLILNASLVNITSAEDDKNFLIFENLDDVKRIFNLYIDKSFDAYLEDILHYNVSDYQTAIYYLFNEYRSEISKANGCVIAMKEQEKKQNKRWINDVVAFAGRDYVLKNIDSFQNLLFNINRKNLRSFCRGNEKDLIFSEVHYLLNVKDFLNYYLSYVETLPENQQKLCTKNINIAKNIIESMTNPPMQTILYGSRIESYLSVLRKVNLKPEVVDYILNHPAFSKPFNLMEAVYDLRKLRIVK